jgi:hypothetical protein
MHYYIDICNIDPSFNFINKNKNIYNQIKLTAKCHIYFLILFNDNILIAIFLP